MSVFRINYYSPSGEFVRTFNSFIRLEYLRRENNYGSMYVDFPPDINPSLFEIDGKFEILRSWNGYLFDNESQTFWLIRLVRQKYDENGKRYVHVLAYDLNHIIERRIVAYHAASTYSKKNMAADTMMKEIMRENFGSLATDGARDLSQYLSIQENTTNTQAPVINKAFSYQKILPLFQDICEESYNLGHYLAFDLVTETRTKYRFEVFNNCRGVDRSSMSNVPLTFSIENGRLSYASFSRDFSEIRNSIYAGGNGEEEDRVVKTSFDKKSIHLSPFNRCEDFISKTDKDPDIVQASANSRLIEAKDKRVLNGHIQQTQSCLYGVHYGFGDIVNVLYDGYSIDVHLDTVKIYVDESQHEDIQINSRNLDDSNY